MKRTKGIIHILIGMFLVLLLPNSSSAKAWPAYCKSSPSSMAQCQRQAKLKAIAKRKADINRAKHNERLKLNRQRAIAKARPKAHHKTPPKNRHHTKHRPAGKNIYQQRALAKARANAARRKLAVANHRKRVAANSSKKHKKASPNYLANFYKNKARYQKQFAKRYNKHPSKGRPSGKRKASPNYVARHHKNRAKYNKQLSRARQQGRSQVKQIVNRSKARTRKIAQNSKAKRSNKRLTHAQTMAIYNQRQRMFNQQMAQSAAAHSTINNSISYNSTARACHISGNCRVVSTPRY